MLGARPAAPGLYTRRTLALALVAGAALVLNWVLLFSAYRLASISLATAVYNVQPFFLIGLGVLFLGERPSAGKLAWSVVAFAGLLLVLRLWDARADGGDYLAGLALGLGAAALYGVTAVIIKRLKAIPPQVLALTQVTLGAVMLPMADFSALPASPLQWSYLVALGLVHTCLMYILMYSAIQKLPTTSTAALSFIYPAVAILLDLLVYGHRMDMAQIAGVALIFLAAAGVSLNWSWRLPRAAPATAPRSGSHNRARPGYWGAGLRVPAIMAFPTRRPSPAGPRRAAP